MNSCLSLKKQEILNQSLKDFDERWDEAASLLKSKEDGHEYHGSRESIYYALALLMRQLPGDADRAVRIIHAVLSLQRLCPGQIWHGTFAYGPEQPVPTATNLDIAALTPLARWQGDVLWGELTPAFRSRLLQSQTLKAHTDEICNLLSLSLRDVFPVVWETYDPNWREFIFSTFAIILEDYESLLPPETVLRIEKAAREGLAGARFRAESGLTPLNTNVEVMHVFFFDAFARRFQDPELSAYADRCAERFTDDYLRYHSVAEFNSPTYNGVVLSYTGLLRTRSRSASVRKMGEVLEQGLWEDFAAFYNPAMKTVCGPFSRAYGLRIDGTAFPMLIYLGVDQVPVEQEPPFGAETESASVICASDVQIPETVQALLLADSAPERNVRYLFRELAERGAPDQNRSLCTATAWITDKLMIGALQGSLNTSHQLHASVVHWRNSAGSCSGFRIRRRTADGRLIHLRTVLFNFTAEAGRMVGTVLNQTTAPILCCLEFESPEAAAGHYGIDCWQVDGLTCIPRIQMEQPDGGRLVPALLAEKQRKDLFWLKIPMNPGELLRLDLRFSLQ